MKGAIFLSVLSPAEFSARPAGGRKEGEEGRGADKKFARHQNRESTRNAQLIVRDSSLLVNRRIRDILQIKSEF